MNALSICSGAGGFDLAAQHLLGWRTLGYVEIADYPQQILASRIRDGVLQDAPIFADLRLLNSDGYASSYRGVAQVVFGGPPCQPFSCAGKSLGADDPRDLSAVVTETLRLVEPQYFFMENSASVKSASHAEHFGDFLAGLAALGYAVEWDCLRACDVGAPHRRDRLWLLARLPRWSAGAAAKRHQRTQRRLEQPSSREAAGSRFDPHPDEGRQPELPQRHGEPGRGQQASLWDDVGGLDSEGDGPWPIESFPSPVAHGVAGRVDRLRASGEGVVPLLAAVAWLRLTGAAR